MAVDVLTYNALAEINQGLRDKIQALDASITAIESASSGGGAMTDTQKAICLSQGWHPQLWCAIPKDPETGSWTSGFKVCDQSGYWRCGCTCNWTVPGGVTCARFQIWGAGAGSGTSCCCGYGVGGSSGAYASVIMPVSPGNTYTLCSGCAYCCHPQWGNMNDGCPSYVQGSGLSNFCVEGGESCLWCQIKAHAPGGKGYCIAETQFISGVGERAFWMSMCANINGNDTCHQDGIMQTSYAWPRSSQNRHHFPMVRSERTYYGSATSGDVWGHNGIYSQMWTGDGMRTCVTHAPVYGHMGCNDNLCNSNTYDACCYCRGGCCAQAQQNGCNLVPSRSGSWNMKCGGHTNYPQGDWGRMGMVCVSYC